MTWVGRTKESKLHRFREMRMFVDPPAYYKPERLMTVRILYPTTPPEYNAIRDTETMVSFHLAAMDMQLRQVQNCCRIISYSVVCFYVILHGVAFLPCDA